MLTEEQKKLVVDNYGLINSFLNNCGRLRKIPENFKDDVVSDIHLSLCNSALKFNNNFNFKFSTYASKCFKGVILDVFCKKMKRYNKNNYLDFDYFNIPIENKINVFDKEKLFNLIKEAELNSQENNIVLEYFFNRKPTKELAIELSLTKQRIHQILKVALIKLRKKTEEKQLTIEDF